MKLKSLSLIAGAIVLTLTAAPFVAQAQNTSPSSLPGVETRNKERGPWEKLNLSEQQKNQIAEIRRNTRTQIEGILTPEQLAQFKAKKQGFEQRRQQRLSQGERPQGQRPQGKRPGGPFADLNLNADQQAKIKQIMESSKQQIEQVLTAEQREQIQKFRENRQSRRQERNR